MRPLLAIVAAFPLSAFAPDLGEPETGRLVSFAADGREVAVCTSLHRGWARTDGGWARADWVCSYAPTPPPSLGRTPRASRRHRRD